MNVLVLAALTDATGNAVTARRIAAHLHGQHRAIVADAVSADVQQLRERAKNEDIVAAIGVHALLAGPVLRAVGLPYGLIFGGTDLYERVHQLQQGQMSRAVAGAARLIAFSPENRARAEWMWPAVQGRVELLPQAVEVPPLEAGFSLRARLGLGKSDILALLPTGIRRVKDPLHVIEAMSVWHAVHPRVHLAVVGAVLEPDYADQAMPQLLERPGIHYVPALPRPQMLAAIAEADVVLNTSLSEGMCGSLLEAMVLGTPVVARRSAGNESLVVHGHTGLLYDAPSELVHWVAALAASPLLRRRLAEAAQERCRTAHGLEPEAAAYQKLVADVAKCEGPASMPPLPPPLPELDLVAPAAERLGLSLPLRAALAALVERIDGDPDLGATTRELSGLLGTAPPGVAIAEMQRLGLERTLGAPTARCLFLALALMQLPNAESRHRSRGVPEVVSRATLGDVAAWAHHLHRLTGIAGITLEILTWAQRYLRGELVQLGGLQFDLRPFAGPMRVFRRRGARELCAITLDGRQVDLQTGIIQDGAAPQLPEADWEQALEPGAPMLEMWIPLNSTVTLASIGESMRQAYGLFAKLAPQTQPLGVCGESWRLDPQVAALMPPELGIGAMQRVCHLYPSVWSEARTLRRLFGPDVDRARLATLPQDAMDPLQRGVAELLTNPAASLRARSGFVLRSEAEAMPEWSR